MTITRAVAAPRLVDSPEHVPLHGSLGQPIGQVTIAVHSDESAFDRLRFEWDELLNGSARPVFFLRRRWNQLWWRHYAPAGSRLHLMTCRDDEGRLLGLAPFYWRQHRIFGVPYARELLFLGMGIDLKSSEYMDVIARRGAERAVGEALAAWLQAHKTWDRIWLWQAPSDSIVLPHLVGALGWRSRTEVCDRAPFIDTSTDWNTFKAGFGRSMRRNVDYYPRRLFKAHPSCRFERVQDGAVLEPAMDALVALHQARWRAQGQPGAFAGGFDVFLREVMRDAFQASRLRLWTLKIDDRTEAALVGFLDNGVLHYFQKGFNPAYAKEDLGTAMLSLCIRDCFNDPNVRAFDFMGGGAAYKDLWARRSRENLVCEVYRPTVRAALYRARERVVTIAANVYRRTVPESLRMARRDRIRSAKLSATKLVTALALCFGDATVLFERMIAGLR